MSSNLSLKDTIIKLECERDHLFFSRYFFKKMQGFKFIVNWHHQVIADALEDVIQGKIKNLVINVPPGSSKTSLVVINFIARGLALNPNARFLHISYSDDLALLNSQTARDLLRSDEFQALWPMKISADAKSKKRWNVVIDGKLGGGVYATSLQGQITGFRAGHMAPGFQGAILLDDLCKPSDASSKSKLDAANSTLLTTIKSRKANPDTPIILIMQRIAENDPVSFIKNGNLGLDWKFVTIPALLDLTYLRQNFEEKYINMIEVPEDKERFSYWDYKEHTEDLLAMERGEGSDQQGSRVSRSVFAAQYQQNPIAFGGNLIKGKDFIRYKALPKQAYRKIFADTAQKTAERNDYSVLALWGKGEDGKIYLIDLVRSKWESPELRRRTLDFWNKHSQNNYNTDFGVLRELQVEDKSSGTDLFQTLKSVIPIFPVQRNTDKLSRVNDALPYIEGGFVCIPEEAPFVSDFLTECEAFTADGSHAHDDQIDPMVDAIMDLLSIGNSLNTWSRLA